MPGQQHAGVEVDPAVPGENPMRVGIDHEAGQAAGIEQNRIGRFGADAVDFEQLLPKLVESDTEHRVE